MKKLDELEEKQSGSAEIFHGNLLHVFKDSVILPNKTSASREYIKHVGAVAIVPMTDDGKIIIERQYRYPLRQVITEIPAGKLNNKQENRLEAAKRELQEETGFAADTWIDIGEYYPAAAYSDEIISLYLAKGLHKGKQNLDDDEFLDVEAVPLKDLVKEVMDGKIGDGKTQAAILKVALLEKSI